MSARPTIITCDTDDNPPGVVNVCSNKSWDGFFTKLRAARDYVASRNGFFVFIDRDIVINTAAYQNWVPNTSVITISAERYCWVGHDCNVADFNTFYNGSARKPFPFVNSGAYMGPSWALKAFLTDVLNNCPQLCKADDQCCFTALRHRHRTLLDTGQQTFASFTGWRKGLSCMTRSGFVSYQCPREVRRWMITPQCDVKRRNDQAPIFVHGNGPAGQLYRRWRHRQLQCLTRKAFI